MQNAKIIINKVFCNFKKIKALIMNQASWCEQSDELLKYLYQDLKIFNWELISKELTQRLGLQTNSIDCRKRYEQTCGPVFRNEWTPEEQKQLYRLHNQNGNKWAVIAQNLLGRNDNCVKNHFYSKLRKSLRTINKIAKLYLKKEAKEVSDVVLYKLTEATDESLKDSSELPPQIIKMCFDLKNRLLDYETDQKDIKGGIDYSFEKQLIQGLCQFNKIYKKKPKKEKITILGTENLKKRGGQEPKGKPRPKKKQMIIYDDGSSNQENSVSNFNSDDQVEILPKKRTSTRKIQLNSLSVPNIGKKSSIIYNSQMNEIPRSQSQYSIARKTLNYVIKAPTKQQRDNYEKPSDLLSQSRKSVADLQQNIIIPIIFPEPLSQTQLQSNMQLPQSQPKTKNKVQDILKAQGILQNADYGNTQRDTFKFTFSRSSRSFSVCSDSSHPDMFGEDLVFSHGFKQLSQMDNQSHSQIFNHQQNQ